MARIAVLLPRKASNPRRTGSDRRLFVNGCLWVLRSGAHWCDLPERYGNWGGAPTLQPLVSCRRAGTVFDALTADRDNQYLMIDSTIVRAH